MNTIRESGFAQVINLSSSEGEPLIQGENSEADRGIVDAIKQEVKATSFSTKYKHDCESLVRAGDALSSELMGLESQWASLLQADFTIREEDRRIQYEVNVKIPGEIKCIDASLAANAKAIESLIEEKNLHVNQHSVYASSRDRVNTGYLGTLAWQSGFCEYKIQPGIHGWSNDSGPHHDIALNIPELKPAGGSWVNSALVGRRLSAEIDGLNLRESFHAQAVGAHHSAIVAEKRSEEIKQHSNRLEAEKVMLEARKSFLMAEQSLRKTAVDQCVLDFDRRAVRLGVRGGVLRNEVTEIANSLWESVGRSGIHNYLDESVISVQANRLEQILKSPWPKDGIEICRRYFQVWALSAARLNSRRRDKIHIERISLGDSATQEIAIGSLDGVSRIEGVFASISKSNITTAFSLEIKFIPKGGVNELVEIIPVVRHSATNDSPDILKTPNFTDISPVGKWILRKIPIKGARMGGNVDVDFGIRMSTIS